MDPHGPNEQPPAVRFCILSAGRTGSTRLRYLVGHHPSVTCHGEVFGENLSTFAAPGTPEEELARAERDRDPVAFLQARVLVAAGKRATGFKALYAHLFTEWPAVGQAIRADQGIRIVHLVRKNLVRRFLSEYLVGTQVVRHRYFHHEDPPPVAPVHVPIDDLLADLRRIDAEVNAVRQAFDGHPMHEIAYEDTIDEQGPPMMALLRFLGLPPARLWAPTRRVLPTGLGSLVANMDDVASALRGTPFEPMLLEDR
ncbi:MAG: hypothetical protein FGM39_02610 [Phycisphaerales bacterium]|nr:hypothetical protein [Phycisphaerales bacterium]